MIVLYYGNALSFTVITWGSMRITATDMNRRQCNKTFNIGESQRYYLTVAESRSLAAWKNGLE